MGESSGNALDVLWKAVSMVDKQAPPTLPATSSPPSVSAFSAFIPLPTTSSFSSASSSPASSPSASPLPFAHPDHASSLRKRVLQNETLKVDTTPQADIALKDKLPDGSPVSPLSLKKLNLTDDQVGEHKRRRSYDKKDSAQLMHRLDSASPHPSPPVSPHVLIARETKQESGNVIRLQVSRNYASAANAVQEHFTRSLSGEFQPPSPIPVATTSTPPPLDAHHHHHHHHPHQQQQQHHQHPLSQKHPLATSSTSSTSSSPAQDDKELTLKALNSTAQPDHLSPTLGDASIGHETSQTGASS